MFQKFIVIVIAPLALIAGGVGGFMLADSIHNDTVNNEVIKYKYLYEAQVFETCRYGDAMFYVARGYDPDTAGTMGYENCNNYYEQSYHTQEYMNQFFAPKSGGLKNDAR